MSAKLEIEWTQISNKFITWGSEICLYETEQLKDRSLPCMKISNTVAAYLQATNSNYHYVKCLDIYPKSNDILLALGQANGKVSLVTFGPSQFDSQGLPGREFVPRHPRQCNAVAWNRIDCNIIAAGLDKYRSDHSVFLWDVVKHPFSMDVNSSGKLQMNTMGGMDIAKPIAEFGMSDMTNSLAWFNTNSKLMAIGMNLKNIRIVDFRDGVKVVSSTPTKATFGICIDLHTDRHLASFFENQACIWDVRNFEKPILTLTHPKPVLKIGWCPTRHNLLASLQRDNSLINLYDIQQTIVGNEEVEPSVLERVVTPHINHNITSFSWHPTEENRLLTITLSGLITDYTVYDRITLNWAPNSNIVWTFGRRTMKYINENSCFYEPLKDISYKIKQRALDGYGLKEEFVKNGDLVDDPMIRNAWKWLQLSSRLVDEGILRGYNSRHPGIRTVVKVDGVNSKSDVISISWAELGNNNCHSSAKIYKHEDREKALFLCNWRYDKENASLTKLLEKLEKEQAYSRAAAIAVFNLKIKTALEILNRGAENGGESSNLSIVAMALAGFSDDKNSVWKQMCANTRVQISDPYLRAMFAFLTAENYSYENVLDEEGMLVEDRVAFACTFLSDGKLQEYLKVLVTELTEKGNLDGLLLTGNNTEGIQLLQQYLDVTGDVQTTTLIAVKGFPLETIGDKPKEWISNYRSLLDVWQLWNERALFDIMLNTYRPNEKPPQQVYVSCNFCGKSISAYMQGLNRGRGPFSRIGGTANKIKMSSCPSCRKPLPRCAICLMHMGTTMGKHFDGDLESNKVVEFSQWFTWCQSCRHGGHASHMIHWFKNHSECPVTPCSCRCFSIDACSNELA